jgi:hypothetical protein
MKHFNGNLGHNIKKIKNFALSLRFQWEHL